MLKREHFQLASGSFRRIAGEMGKTAWMKRGIEILGEKVTFIAESGHMDAIADKLDEASKHDEVMGCCWQGTTVGADAWNDGAGYRDGDDEAPRPFNIFKDKNHPAMQWWINPTSLESDDELDGFNGAET
jgi:hypothetical protein